MKNKFLFSILIIIFIQSSYCQSYETQFPKSYGILFGYQGYQKNLVEIGVVKGLEGLLISGGLSKRKHMKIQRPYSGLYGSIHFNPIENVKGLNIGFSGAGGAAVGLDFNYYKYVSDFWGLRLSYGLSFFGFETIYRYNFRLKGAKVSGISGHLFSIRYYLPFFISTDNKYSFNTKRSVF